MNQQNALKMDDLTNSLQRVLDTNINTSGLSPLGHAILVRTYEPEIRSSVIHIPMEARGRMQMIEQRRIVVAVGPSAWEGESVARAKPGDKVLVTKFAGYETNQTKDGESYRVVNDRDVF